MSDYDSWDYEELDEAPRWLYAVGGSLLIWLGLRRWSLPAAVVTGAGAFLLSRALPEPRTALEPGVVAGGAVGPTTRTGSGASTTATPAAPGNAVRDAVDAMDYVDETSDESFPASDPPSWTPTTSVGPSHG